MPVSAEKKASLRPGAGGLALPGLEGRGESAHYTASKAEKRSLVACVQSNTTAYQKSSIAE